MPDLPIETRATDLLRWLEVPHHRNVFALGTYGQQVTFASQQTRALNLIWALAETGRLVRDQRVAVVGAGLGGLMSVVAANALGCEVHLYEQASQSCPVQRGNDLRFIHPNILNWPAEGSDKTETDFPFLNWTAANTRGVIKQIDLQWKRVRSDRVRRFFNYRVNRLYMLPQPSGDLRPVLTANRLVEGRAASDETKEEALPGYLEYAYDCVILAVGFGAEKELAGVPLLFYWENDSLHQETGRGRTEILVSGCGDGGLIDALRLRVRNFDHAHFVRHFVSAGESSTLVSELQRIDTELQQHALAPDISLRFRAAYDALPSSSALTSIESYFRERRRSDTSVTLNSPAVGPLSFQASLLNRFATYLAMRHVDLHYLSGRVTAERTNTGSYSVTFTRSDNDCTETRTFNRVIVRHGPKSAIEGLLPGSALKELREWWLTHADETTKPYWQTGGPERSRQIFGVDPNDTAPLPEDVWELALATFEPAFRRFVEDEGELSIAVGRHEGKAGFIVTRPLGRPPKGPERFAGVLVQYLIPTSSTDTPSLSRPSTTGTTQLKRVVESGVGIYNYDASRREMGPPDSDSARFAPRSGIGTLGVFAKDASGALYLISMAHVLSPGMSGRPGDLIFIEGESPEAGNREIATLLVPEVDALTTDGGIEGVSGVAAKLVDDVEPSYRRFPEQWRPLSAGSTQIGESVYTVGRSSDIAHGVVVSIASDYAPLGTPARSDHSSEYVEISAPEGSRFSSPGDSGALVVSRGGVAVGLVAARYVGPGGGNNVHDVTIARSLQTITEELGLTPYFASGGDEFDPE